MEEDEDWAQTSGAGIRVRRKKDGCWARKLARKNTWNVESSLFLFNWNLMNILSTHTNVFSLFFRVQVRNIFFLPLTSMQRAKEFVTLFEQILTFPLKSICQSSIASFLSHRGWWWILFKHQSSTFPQCQVVKSTRLATIHIQKIWVHGMRAVCAEDTKK